MIISKKQHPVINFPKLMIDQSRDNLTVLFSETKTGVCVTDSSKYPMGMFNREWDMKNFTDFTGDIVLANSRD